MSDLTPEQREEAERDDKIAELIGDDEYAAIEPKPEPDQEQGDAEDAGSA